jgi:hypothetical protein
MRSSSTSRSLVWAAPPASTSGVGQARPFAPQNDVQPPHALQFLGGRNEIGRSNPLGPGHALADILADHHEVGAGAAGEIARQRPFDWSKQHDHLGPSGTQASNFLLRGRGCILGRYTGFRRYIRIRDTEHANLDGADGGEVRRFDEAFDKGCWRQIHGQAFGRHSGRSVGKIAVSEGAAAKG